MEFNFQHFTNIESDKKTPTRKIVDFLETYRQKQIDKEDLNYLELRRNAIDTYNLLSNFLLVISTLLIPITLGITSWDFDFTKHKSIIWLNLVSGLFLIGSLLFGAIYIIKNGEFYNKLINLTNQKSENYSKIKYDIFNDNLEENLLKQYIYQHDNLIINHNQINVELSKDTNNTFLYLQGIFILISLFIMFFEVIYFLSI